MSKEIMVFVKNREEFIAMQYQLFALGNVWVDNEKNELWDCDGGFCSFMIYNGTIFSAGTPQTREEFEEILNSNDSGNKRVEGVLKNGKLKIKKKNVYAILIEFGDTKKANEFFAFDDEDGNEVKMTSSKKEAIKRAKEWNELFPKNKYTAVKLKEIA